MTVSTLVCFTSAIETYTSIAMGKGDYEVALRAAKNLLARLSELRGLTNRDRVAGMFSIVRCVNKYSRSIPYHGEHLPPNE